MTTIFADTPKYPGQRGDHARVTVSPLGDVLIRAVDIVAEEALTIAMSPDQHVTKIDDDAGQGDRWNGHDFTNQQDAHDPTPVDDAIAAILNAVVCDALRVPAPAVPDDARPAMQPGTYALIELMSLGFIEHHRCGACSQPVGYEIHPDMLAIVFNSGCGCSGRSNYRPVTHAEWVDFVNRRAALTQPTGDTGA